LHIVYVIAPGGGPEAYIKKLLPYFRRQGVVVSVIFTTEKVDARHHFPDDVNMSFVRTRGPGSYYARRIQEKLRISTRLPVILRSREFSRAVCHALSEIDRRQKIDLVEVTEGASIRAWSHRWPVVVRAHGSAWSFRHFCRDAADPLDAYRVRRQARQIRAAAGAAAISRHTAQHLTQFCGLQPGTVTSIYYPMDSTAFQPKPKPLDPDPFTLLSVGRLETRKGTDILVRAMNKVWKVDAGLHLVLLGYEGNLSVEKLRSMVDPAFGNKIEHHSFVPHAEIASYYQKADGYMAPSQYETFGYTVLEAMATGTPLICTNVGALPELVSQEDNGLLVPYGDVGRLAQAILRLRRDSALRERMIRNGLDKVERFSVKPIGSELLGFYREAMARHRRHRD